MACSSILMINKFLLTLFILNFLFLSCSPCATDHQHPPLADLPKLCNLFDNSNFDLFDDIESCNVGLLHSCNIKEIYQFGDSISDVGNSIREDTTTPFAELPYGINFPEGPTGRASNGRLMIDYFAIDAGLPLLPPYINRDADFSHGVNFAVAGSTALAWDELAALNISTTKTNTSLSVQLDSMSAYFYSLCNFDLACGEKFGDSLFIMGPFGGSDYYEALIQNKTIQEIRTKMVPKVVDAIVAGVRRLIGLGAKRVVVPGLYSNMYLSEDHLAFQHNIELRSAIDKLKEEEMSNAIVAFEDYSDAYANLDNYALELGRFMHPSACCGSGGGMYKFEASRMCGEMGVSACADPDQHVSWDGIHLTQEANRIMSKFMLYHFFLDLQCPYPASNVLLQ